jgi:hypothetical protein
MWTYGEEKNLSSAGNQTPTVWLSSHSLPAILTELSCLWYDEKKN